MASATSAGSASRRSGVMSSMRPMEHPVTGALTRYTVGVFNGEQGAGKSTRQAFVRRLIDPREPASMNLPDKIDDLVIYSENSAVISLTHAVSTRNAGRAARTGAGLERLD